MPHFRDSYNQCTPYTELHWMMNGGCVWLCRAMGTMVRSQQGIYSQMCFAWGQNDMIDPTYVCVSCASQFQSQSCSCGSAPQPYICQYRIVRRIGIATPVQQHNAMPDGKHATCSRHVIKNHQKNLLLSSNHLFCLSHLTDYRCCITWTVSITMSTLYAQCPKSAPSLRSTSIMTNPARCSATDLDGPAPHQTCNTANIHNDVSVPVQTTRKIHIYIIHHAE